MSDTEHTNNIIHNAFKESQIRSPANLQRYIKTQYSENIPLSEIKRFLQEKPEIVIQSNKQIDDFKIVGDIGSYQADLTFYEQYSKKNKGYIGLLVVIEIPTRLVYIELIKNKTGSEISEKFDEICRRVKNPIKNLSMDAGSEFINKNFDKVLNEHNIIPYYHANKNSMSIVERMNRTIREKIQTLFNDRKNLVYYDKIENHSIEKVINDSYNRMIDKTPNNIKKEDIEKINKKNKDHNHRLFENININVGDKVRLKKNKETFDKTGNK